MKGHTGENYEIVQVMEDGEYGPTYITWHMPKEGVIRVRVREGDVVEMLKRLRIVTPILGEVYHV